MTEGDAPPTWRSPPLVTEAQKRVDWVVIKPFGKSGS